MEYGASCEDVARVCHAHPVRIILLFFFYANCGAEKIFSKFICAFIFHSISNFHNTFLKHLLVCLQHDSIIEFFCRHVLKLFEKQIWLATLENRLTFSDAVRIFCINSFIILVQRLLMRNIYKTHL